MKLPTFKRFVTALLLLSSTVVAAQIDVAQGVKQGKLKRLGTSGILKNKKLIKPQRPAYASSTKLSLEKASAAEISFDVKFSFADPLYDLLQSGKPIFNIEGIDRTEAANAPIPNPNGDISPDHYVQLTNSGQGSVFKIFDKSGNALYGPASLNTFWADFNITGFGSPIVLWDQGAERWLLSELGTFGTNKMLIAISQTKDPMGDWYIYEFQAPNLPKSPKYGIWPDAYYVTTDEDGADIPIYALEREAMLSGNVNAGIQRLGIPRFAAANSFALQLASPADWDGTSNMPPAGSPHYLLRMYDDAWDGGNDKLEIWELKIDWDDSMQTMLIGPIELWTEPFDSDVCNGSIFDCLQQPDNSSIGALMQVLMHRVNYRNFGTHESIVLNHVIDVDGNNRAGIRWYELRKEVGQAWTIHQQGTIASEFEDRFMGSIAIDANGNIGLAYSTLGEDKHLSLAFTGRHENDTLGKMTIEEHEFAQGLSPLSGSRWGEYAMMSVDEQDGSTFWFTGAYMKESNNWGTKIISFKIQQDAVDIGPEKLLSPENSPYLTDSESLVLRIKNFGLLPQDQFRVGIFVNDAFLGEQLIEETIFPDQSIDITLDGIVLDASQVGDYNFKINTTLSSDENIFNDTLRTIVKKLTRHDAAVTGFTSLETAVCDTFLNPGIIITNEGAEPLNSVELIWQRNNQMEQSVPWNGYLETAESDTIFILLDDLNGGTNQLFARTLMPNGIVDENDRNDDWERQFEVVSGGETVYLHLTTDFYPAETSWTLSDEDGIVLYESPAYDLSNTTYVEEWCLVEGCYTFTIYDEFGDGMSFGDPGFYQILDEDGKLFARMEAANFGSNKAYTFCTPFACDLDGELSIEKESEFGAFDGAINITPVRGFPPFQYSINNGLNTQDTSVFSGLQGNIYYVVVTDENECEFREEVVLETCTLQFSVVATNATAGKTDGSILVTTENGVPPFQYSIDNGQTFQDSSLFTNLDTAIYTILVEDSLGCQKEYDVGIYSMPVHTIDLDPISTIEILPNPTNERVRINIRGLDEIQTLEVDLLTTSGQVIHSSQLTRYNDLLMGSFSLKAFPTGMYFIRFKHPNLLRLEKVIRY